MSCFLEERAFREAAERAVRVLDGRHSRRRDAEETLGPPAAFRGRISYSGLHEILGFETIKRGLDGADRHFSPRACFDLPPDGEPVGLITKAQDRQKDHVFKFVEVPASRY